MTDIAKSRENDQKFKSVLMQAAKWINRVVAFSDSKKNILCHL